MSLIRPLYLTKKKQKNKENAKIQEKITNNTIVECNHFAHYSWIVATKFDVATKAEVILIQKKKKKIQNNHDFFTFIVEACTNTILY